MTKTETPSGRILAVPKAVLAKGADREHLALFIALVLLDVIALGIAFRVAHQLRFATDIQIFNPEGAPAFDFYTMLVIKLIPAWVILFALFRLYDDDVLFSGWREYMLVFNATSAGILLIMAVSFLDTEFVIARGWLLISWFTVTFTVTAERFVMRRVVHRLRGRGHLVTGALIVGANNEGVSIAQQLHDAPTAGIYVIGFLDDALPHGTEVMPGLRVLGRIADARHITSRYHVKELMVATSALHREQMVEFIEQQWRQSNRVNVRLSTGMYEILTTSVNVKDVGAIPFMSVNEVRLTGFDVVMKRTMDIVIAGMGLVMLCIILPLIAWIIKRDSPGPIFYRRRVVGVGEREFDAFKFRTMVTNGEEVLEAYFAEHPDEREVYYREFKLKDDPRITRIGRFLRKISFDELPQLVNVLLGQMSFVGPRMITKPELANYGKRAMNLLTVKPGLTGLWQVSGRSDVSYEERVRLDMYYIRNWSIWLDIQIAFQTAMVVLKGKGAY